MLRSVQEGVLTVGTGRLQDGGRLQRVDERSLNIAFSRADVVIVICVEYWSHMDGLKSPEDTDQTFVRGYGRMCDASKDQQFGVQWLRLHDIPIRTLDHLHIPEREAHFTGKPYPPYPRVPEWMNTGKRVPLFKFTGTPKLPRVVGAEICRLLDACVFGQPQQPFLPQPTYIPRRLEIYLAQDFRAALDGKNRYKLGRQFGRMRREVGARAWDRDAFEDVCGGREPVYSQKSIHQTRPYKRARLYASVSSDGRYILSSGGAETPADSEGVSVSLRPGQTLRKTTNQNSIISNTEPSY